MASYRVEVSATAERQIRKLPHADQVRVVSVIQTLATEPRPSGCRKLSGYDDVFRVRVGRYRVLYSVEGRRLIIIVLKVGDRKDVYR
ncbi:type II toxin-antitoxin system RelE/ParE family toxin [Candidatus Binatia bacterium]|jgi:mRNA interferase RelE/StbE|nr:type II toxin-antitoxin system RelE/ParE family toxin [Candidatus Binatia bacterium]